MLIKCSFFVSAPGVSSPFILSLIFISPTLPIIHKWMVRLTVPLIFISVLQAAWICAFYKVGGVLRGAAIALVALFLIWNYYGIQVHEDSSLMLLESRIVRNAETYFALHKVEIIKHPVIYFVDSERSAWGGSEKLKVTLHDQNFVSYFFPGQTVSVLYGYEKQPIPEGAYVIESDDILERPEILQQRAYERNISN